MNESALSNHSTNLVNTACPALFRFNFLDSKEIAYFINYFSSVEYVRLKGFNKL